MHLCTYVPPTAVRELAERLRRFGITVTVEGTEAIHTKGAEPYQVVAALGYAPMRMDRIDGTWGAHRVL